MLQLSEVKIARLELVGREGFEPDTIRTPGSKLFDVEADEVHQGWAPAGAGQLEWLRGADIPESRPACGVTTKAFASSTAPNPCRRAAVDIGEKILEGSIFVVIEV